MKVAVNKKILFNVLKKHLQENRTANSSLGNFIHPFNIQSPNSDPFGIYEDDDDDAPIKPTAHMSTQLSEVEPPVDDEDYIPGNTNELRSAAAVISREVPDSQVEYFYRKLHELLDDALDREDESFLIDEDSEESQDEETMNESVNISTKTTIRDLTLFKEARIKVRSGGKQINPATSAPTDEFSDIPSYLEIEDEEGKAEFKTGYELGVKHADLDIMLADGDIDQADYDSQIQSIDIIVKTGSIDFQAGFDEGKGFIESTSGMELSPMEPDTLPFPERDNVLDPNTEYENRSFEEFLARSGLTPEQNADPVIDFLIQSHLAVQEYSQNLEDEYTTAMQLFYSDPKSYNRLPAEYISKMIKPTQAALKFSNVSALTPLRVKEMMKTFVKDDQARFVGMLENAAKIKTRVIKMLNLKMEQSKAYKRYAQEIADAFGMKLKAFINEIADIIAEDYGTYGSQKKYEEGSDQYIRNEVKKSRNRAFRIFIEDLAQRNISQAVADKEAGIEGRSSVYDSIPTFSNTDKTVVTPQVILKYVTPENYDDFKGMVLTDLDDRLKKPDGSYEIFDQGEKIVFDEAQVLEIFEVEMSVFEEQMQERHGIPDEDDLEDVDIDEDDTIEQVNNTEREMMNYLSGKLRELERLDTDWKYMAPFYGFSGPSGVRQWTLKGPKRKYDLLNSKDPQAAQSVREAFNSTYYKIIDPLIDAMEAITITTQDKITKGKDKPTQMAKGSIKQLGEQDLIQYLQVGVADLKEFNELIDQMEFREVAETHPDLMQSDGVKILRNIVGRIIDKPLSVLETEMTSEIADIIYDFADEKGLNPSEKDCEWAAYYFTDLIDRPFQEVSVKDTTQLRKNAAKKQLVFTKPDKLALVGIHTAEDYMEVEQIANETIIGHAKQFGTRTGRGGTVTPQRYLRELNDEVTSIVAALENAAKPGAKKGDQKKAVDLITKGSSTTAEDERLEQNRAAAQQDILDDNILQDLLDSEDIDAALARFAKSDDK